MTNIIFTMKSGERFVQKSGGEARAVWEVVNRFLKNEREWFEGDDFFLRSSEIASISIEEVA